MSKHTPGPWQTLNTAHIFTGLGAARADGTTAPSDDGWMIADCDAGSLPLDEIRANAQLIAAAPELLAALTGALKAWDALYQSPKMNWDGDFDESEDFEFREMSAARAAIAKATGGGR